MEKRLTIKDNRITDGKMPPQVIELESCVLGSILSVVNTMHELAEILQPESFYKDCNMRIYKACISLHKQSIRTDIVTVIQELRRTEELEIVGGAYYISQLPNNESTQPEYHARIIQQKFIQRELIKLCTETINSSYLESSDCLEIIDTHERNLTLVTKSFSVGKVETIASLWNKALEHNQILLTKKGISGIPSGYNAIDEITGGFQQPDLIIIAARPAMGKTSLVCNFARNASVDYKYPGVIFSLEMSSLQIATRIFALESDTNISDFMRNGIDNDQMVYIGDRCTRLINSPLFIDDTASISLSELKSKARKLKREKGIKFIIVDYLQLMSGEKGVKSNREQEISTISRGLKGLAKELEIPVIALSQLSRESEKRSDKRPMLSDLRESGAIEQDADIVMFIHRPEYYGIMEYESGESTVGIAEIIFAKHRNGGIGTEKLTFISRLTKFVSINSIDNFQVKNNLQPNKYFEVEKEESPF